MCVVPLQMTGVLGSALCRGAVGHSQGKPCRKWRLGQDSRPQESGHFGSARVLDTEDAAMDAILGDRIKPGDMLVLC